MIFSLILGIYCYAAVRCVVLSFSPLLQQFETSVDGEAYSLSKSHCEEFVERFHPATSVQSAPQSFSKHPPASLCWRPAVLSGPVGHNGGRIWKGTVHQLDANRLTHLHNLPLWDGPED